MNWESMEQKEREWKRTERKTKNLLQKEWKNIIFKRDNYQCRICNWKDHLHLAHITQTKHFINNNIPIKFSYSEDNLITLCRSCHWAFHCYQKGRGKYTEEQRQKALLIVKLFKKIKKERKWSMPYKMEWKIQHNIQMTKQKNIEDKLKKIESLPKEQTKLTV